MYRTGIVILLMALTFGVVVVAAEGNGATTEVDQDLFTVGQELFETNCSVCHQSTGQGNPPAFPALAGNDNLQDVSLIVKTIHEGRGVMPPFPQFGAEEIGALATYIRNAWQNDFGGVSVEAVAAQLQAAEDGGEVASLRSVWEGVFTQEQAERGEPIYTSSCSVCHGYMWVWRSGPGVRNALKRPNPHLMLVSDPTLGPPLSGEPFLTGWDGQTVGALYALTRSTMPFDNPGTLSDQQYIDIIAFLFAASDIPAGEEELPPTSEVLNNIIIEATP